jgi:tetraacyldisaccharide 4'-kinase
VVANPDRVAAGNWSMENLNANLFVLDDGFQHLRLARNLDLVVIDATNPWGGGRLLPSGRLRETPEALARASCVIITRADQVEDIAPLRTQIQELADDAPVLSSRMITSRISTLAGQSVNPPDIKQPVGAFCGVGNPESFFAQLRNEGQALTFTRAFPDHHRYSQAEINDLEGAAKASGAQTLITTAKDATKLSSLDLGLPCYVLEIEISIDGEERLIKLIRDAIA